MKIPKHILLDNFGHIKLFDTSSDPLAQKYLYFSLQNSGYEIQMHIRNENQCVFHSNPYYNIHHNLYGFLNIAKYYDFEHRISISTLISIAEEKNMNVEIHICEKGVISFILGLFGREHEYSYDGKAWV